MRRAALVVFAALLIARSLTAQAPSDDEAGRGDQQHAAPHDQTAEENSASSSTVSATAQTAEQSHKDECAPTPDIPWWRDPNWIIALFAIVTGVATTAYAVIASCTLSAISEQARIASGQLAEMQKQGATAATAAEAAQLSAQTAAADLEHQIALERPRLIVKGNGFPRFKPDPSEAPRHVYVTVPWSVVNVGRSPALLHQHTVRVALVPDDFPPQTPRLDREENAFGELTIGTTEPHSGDAFITLRPDEAAEISPGLKCLAVYGIARYRDVAGGDHFHRFSFFWHPILPPNLWWYEPVGGPDSIEST